MAKNWEVYAHMLESELVDTKKERDCFQTALEKLQVVADDRLQRIKTLSLLLEGTQKDLAYQIEERVRVDEENDNWEHALWAVLMGEAKKVLAAEGIPEAAINAHVRDASDCFIEVLESYSEAYMNSNFRESVLYDFWQNVIGYLE